MNSLDQLTDFDSLLEQIDRVKCDNNTSLEEKAEYFHFTIVEQVERFSEIERVHLYRYLKLSEESQDLLAAYEALNEDLTRELRDAKDRDAELKHAVAALEDAEKGCLERDRYIRSAEKANAELKKENKEQKNAVKSWKQEWQALKDELAAHDKTIDYLQQRLQSKGALVEKYEEEIKSYREKRQFWQQQVDEATDCLEGKKDMMEWLEGVTKGTKGKSPPPLSRSKTLGSELSRAGTSQKPTAPTTGSAADKSKSEAGSEIDPQATPKANSYSFRKQQSAPSASSMDCASDGPGRSRSTSIQALEIRSEISAMDWEPIEAHEPFSPASEYGLEFHLPPHKRPQQGKAEKRPCPVDGAEDDDLTRKRCRQCGSLFQKDNEGGVNPDVEEGEGEDPLTPRASRYMTLPGEGLTVSRSTQTTNDLHEPTIVESIETPGGSSKQTPKSLLADGRVGYYKNPVYLPKSYPKPQRLDHDLTKPRQVSMIRPVLRNRIGSWPLNLEERKSVETGDIQLNISSWLASSSSQSGNEAPLSPCTEAGIPNSPPSDIDISSAVEEEEEELHMSLEVPPVFGGKWWLSLLMGLVLLVSMLFHNKESRGSQAHRQSWNEVNIIPQTPFTMLQRNPESRPKGVRASRYEVFRLSEKDYLSFG